MYNFLIIDYNYLSKKKTRTATHQVKPIHGTASGLLLRHKDDFLASLGVGESHEGLVGAEGLLAPLLLLETELEHESLVVVGLHGYLVWRREPKEARE